MTTPAEHNDAQKFQDIIYDVLKNNIISGAIPVGFVLGETDVARFFGISRAPVSHALKRLMRQKLICRFDGRGYMVGSSVQYTPLRGHLAGTSVHLPDDTRLQLVQRNHRDRIYPDLELQISSVLAVGEFQVSEKGLADHYGVSRTVARELLTQLFRLGLMTQNRSGRWVTPLLSDKSIADHYEMRIRLEPVAIVDAARHLPDEIYRAALSRIQLAKSHAEDVSSAEVLAIENDLHKSIVLNCSNQAMRDAIHRSQLPLIATHLTFKNTRDSERTNRMLDEHAAVLNALLEKNSNAAAALMTAHLQTALETSEERLRSLEPKAFQRLPGFLQPIET